MNFTNIGLLENTIKCYQKSNFYIYGTYGQKLTSAVVESKIKQYPNFYRTEERIKNAREAVGKCEYAYDCVGLIKSYLFGGIGNVKYNNNYDKSANGMYNASKEKGSILNIPNIKGLLVWMNGHIGVYDGEKYSYECTTSNNSFKIIKTVAKTRGWTNWCKCPYISYESEFSMENNLPNLSNYSGQSIVDALNSVNYDSSYSSRKDLANKLGILNYTGTAEQNLKMIALLKGNTSDVTYLKNTNYKGTSIVEALNQIKIDSSYNYRAKLAEKNGISNYKGTASQNTQMLSLLKNGKLIKE